MNLAKIVENKIEQAPNFVELTNGLQSFDAFIAGGFIRNTLLKIPVNDIDIFVDASLEQLSNYLVELEKYGNVKLGPFGAPRWFSKTDNFYADIVPFSKFVVNQKSYSSINQILKDFDITINAIAFDINNKVLIDPINGISDLEKRIIKATHLNFPDFKIISGNNEISSLSVFWFRLVHYKCLLNFNFEEGTYKWLLENKERYDDLEKFKQLFFNPNIDNNFLKSLI